MFNCFPSDKVSTFREFNSYCKKERLIDIDLEKSKNLLLEIKGHLVDLPLKFLNSEDLSPKLSDGMTGLMPMTIWT